jgi:hypothetical protein
MLQPREDGKKEFASAFSSFPKNLREHQKCTQKVFVEIKLSTLIRVSPSLIQKKFKIRRKIEVDRS